MLEFLREKKGGVEMVMSVQFKCIYVVFMLINLCLNIYANKTKNKTLEIVTWAIVLHVPIIYIILSH